MIKGKQWKEEEEKNNKTVPSLNILLRYIMHRFPDDSIVSEYYFMLICFHAFPKLYNVDFTLMSPHPCS